MTPYLDAYAAACLYSSVCLLPASPPSASDVIGSLYVLQFLIHLQSYRWHLTMRRT